MALDPSIALQSQVPDPTNLISKFVNLGQQKLLLDKSRATFDADVAGAQAQSSSAQSRAAVDAANVQPLIDQQSAQTGLAKYRLSGEQAAQGMQLASGLISDPAFAKGDTDGMLQRLNDAQDTMVKQFGIDPKIADATVTTLKYQAIHSPQTVRQSLINMTMQQQGGAGQQAAALPTPGMVNTGSTVQPVAAGNPELTGIPAGTFQGVPVKLGLPVTAPVINAKGLPSYAGSQDVQSGYAPGQVEGVTGPVASNNAHFAQVQQEAAGASDRIAALNNIKQEISKATMGGSMPGNAIRSLLSGMSGVFGFANDSTTANDLMAKNLAQIASRSGNTDAARTLGELGSPNAHVTADAAREAVAQISGIEQKKQAASAYFSGIATNSPDYSNKLQMWNKYADPRAFQYASLPANEQATMKAAMKKAGTWATLNNNMSHLAAMGVNP